MDEGNYMWNFEVLVTLLRRKTTHGWEQDFEVLLVVYWLAHGLSVVRCCLPGVWHPQINGVWHCAFNLQCHPGPGGNCPRAYSGTVCWSWLWLPAAFSQPSLQPLCWNHWWGPSRPPKTTWTGSYNALSNSRPSRTAPAFLGVFVEYPGPVHDTRVLRNRPVFTSGRYPSVGHFTLGMAATPVWLHQSNSSPHNLNQSGKVWRGTSTFTMTDQ